MSDERDTVQREIAATAARLIVEEGMEYGPAKQRALKVLGLPKRSALPGNEELEDEVRDYLALFCADTQPAYPSQPKSSWRTATDLGGMSSSGKNSSHI